MTRGKKAYSQSHPEKHADGARRKDQQQDLAENCRKTGKESAGD
jgi:hypothetical protein